MGDTRSALLVRTAASLTGNHGIDDRPFLFCHVAFVAFAVTYIIPASGPIPRKPMVTEFANSIRSFVRPLMAPP